MSGTEIRSPESAAGTVGNQSLSIAVSDDKDTIPMMAGKTQTEKKDVTGKTKRKIREPAPIKEGLTTVAHCCVLAFVLLILYLCFKQPFEFFTWHPLLLSLGWMLLVSQAILVISKENTLAQKFRLTHDGRIQLHWIFFTVGAILIGTGFLIITINKNRLNKSHYTSWHGLLGLIAVISYIPPVINGVLTYYSKDLKNYMNPKLVKLVHVVTGTLCFACGGLSLILSVYTKWFGRRTANNVYVFYFALVIAIFPVVWVTQRPLIKAVKNIYNLFKADD